MLPSLDNLTWLAVGMALMLVPKVYAKVKAFAGKVKAKYEELRDE